MLQLEVLVGELHDVSHLSLHCLMGTHLVAVNRLSAGTISLREVTSLGPGGQCTIPRRIWQDKGYIHKALDDSVEARSLVSET